MRKARRAAGPEFFRLAPAEVEIRQRPLRGVHAVDFCRAHQEPFGMRGVAVRLGQQPQADPDARGPWVGRQRVPQRRLDFVRTASGILPQRRQTRGILGASGCNFNGARDSLLRIAAIESIGPGEAQRPVRGRNQGGPDRQANQITYRARE
jgi:hypothetical protein